MPYEIANKEQFVGWFQNTIPPHHNYVVWYSNGHRDRHGEWCVASGSSFDEAVASFEAYVNTITSTQDWVDAKERLAAAQADITRWKVKRLADLEFLIRKYLVDGDGEELRNFLS